MEWLRELLDAKIAANDAECARINKVSFEEQAHTRSLIAEVERGHSERRAEMEVAIKQFNSLVPKAHWLIYRLVRQSDFLYWFRDILGRT